MAGQKGRRGNGEGSITLMKGKNGAPDRWVARLSLPDGRRKAFYSKTRQEAAQRLTKALRDRDMGLRAAGDERQTLGQYLTRWLETVRPTIKPRTWDRYEGAIRVHIIPALGTVKLSKLTAHQVQAFYSRKLSEGLAAGTVAHQHAVLHRALDHAERLDLVPRNVADKVTPPRARPHDMTIFTAEQAQAILAAIAGDRLEAAYVLAFTTGIRQGELLALRWRNVDLDAGTVHIEETLHWNKGGTWRLSTPKTERSRRTIDLPPMAIEALRTHRTRQLAERLAMGSAYTDSGLVFANKLGAPIRGHNLRVRHFYPLLARLGLPKARWHDLRHAFVSLASAEGVPIQMISQMIGHSSTVMTQNVYLHVLPGMGKQAAIAMERALRGNRKTEERLPG